MVVLTPGSREQRLTVHTSNLARGDECALRALAATDALGHTAPVTAPTTGFAYLDEVPGDRGAVLAFAHRGGAYHPEIEGLENTLAAFRHAVGSATTTSRPTSTSPATACCSPSTTPCSTGSPTGRARRRPTSRGAHGAGRRPRAGAHAGRALRRVPRRAVQHRPEVRRRGAGPGRLHRPPATPTTGSWSAPSRRGAARVPPADPWPGADLRAPRRGGAFGFLPSGRLADWLPGAGARPSRSRTGAAGARSPAGLVRRAHAAAACPRLDRRRPRRDGASCSTGASTGCSPTAPTCSRPCSRSAADGGSPHDDEAGGCRSRAAQPGQGAEGLVLVRLGQQRLRHHDRDGALRAVPHLDRRAGRAAASPTTTRLKCSENLRSSASASRPARWSSTSSPSPRSSRRWCCRSSAPSPTGRAQEEASWPASPGPARSSAGCMFFMTGDNWQLGAVLHRAPTLSRLLPGRLLRDPVEIADPTSATGSPPAAGPWLPRRRPAAGRQPRRGARPRRDRAQRGMAVRISLLCAACGGRPSRSSRSAAQQPAAGHACRESGGLVRASFGQLARPSRTCATTR